MKKVILSICSIFVASSSLLAQTADTVSIGASYVNQVWYNLDQGTETSVSGTSWDLAFQISGFSAVILANTAYGAELYIYPNGDTGSWASLDTAGIGSWEAWHNSATTWDRGAFNQGINPNNSLDLGWGQYNFITHHVTGDSLFVWKTASGSIKKIWIENLAAGAYNFKIADYNGANLKQVSVNKSNFQGKNFAYYSIAQDTVLDLEPLSSSWDLVFSKYIDYVPTAYSVSGIRTNIGLEAVKVYPVNNPASYNNTAGHNYSSDINVIGHDWKSFNFGTFSYDIEDSTVYLVKVDTNTYWKLVMKGFGGSANGNFIFEKTLLSQLTGIGERVAESGNFMLYPNPVTGRSIQLVTDLPLNTKEARVQIFTMNGQLLREEQLRINNSFETHELNLSNLKEGMYVLHLIHEEGTLSRKLILK
jgi:hypothetical protein